MRDSLHHTRECASLYPLIYKTPTQDFARNAPFSGGGHVIGVLSSGVGLGKLCCHNSGVVAYTHVGAYLHQGAFVIADC